jgi:heparan sulfate 2-O-sulfotransferase HS2ST1
MNVTRNQHTLHVSDQVALIANVSNWVQRKPAVYHGHLAFIDFTK